MIHLQTAMNADRFGPFNALLARAEAFADAALLFSDAAGAPAPNRRKFLDDILAVPFLSRYLNRSPYPVDTSDERVDYAIDALADAIEATEHHGGEQVLESAVRSVVMGSGSCRSADCH